jgi:hypothetical protein
MSLLPSQDQHELVIQFVQVRECSGNPNTSSKPYASEFLPLLIDVLDGHHLIYQNKKNTISIIGSNFYLHLTKTETPGNRDTRKSEHSEFIA